MYSHYCVFYGMHLDYLYSTRYAFILLFIQSSVNGYCTFFTVAFRVTRYTAQWQRYK
jgi:hypothetical protein